MGLQKIVKTKCSKRNGCLCERWIYGPCLLQLRHLVPISMDLQKISLSKGNSIRPRLQVSFIELIQLGTTSVLVMCSTEL